ncbi:MAG: DNA methyltransferase [Chloroflexota bacterium]|nr:DNA methyltransferase [Chloroflexota bacterium]
MILSSGIYQKTLLNTSEVAQSELDIENKIRSNPLAWNGQFSPQLIQVLLSVYARPGFNIFDPFLGSGTVLLEAGRAGLLARGTEINPAAVALAQTYQFINTARDSRRSHTRTVQKMLCREFPADLPLFRDSGQTRGKLDAEEIKARFAKLLPTVANHLQHQLLETLAALLDFYKPDLSVKKVFTTWRSLSQLVTELPYSRETIEVYHADARATPLPDATVDLVITSPPYINVFNYHQQYRASMETLNWDILKVAKSEIGSNRKNRGNRFLTVIQYCLDTAQTFYEMARICKPNTRLIFIVGRESTVRGTRIFNGELVAEVAHRALGFDLRLRQERVFRNRFGQDIFEDILHFSPPRNNISEKFLTNAKELAREVLKKTCSTAPDKAKDDVESAIENIETVKPSPIFSLSKTPKTQRG